MKKKGFTLIELLAVIVILAIIALIATPLVLKYIEKSRQESKVDSAYSFVRNLETEIANYSIKNKGSKFNKAPKSGDYYELGDFEKDKDIDTTVKGDTPEGIKVCLTSLGQVDKAMFEYGKYYVSYDGKKGSITDETTYNNFSCSGNVAGGGSGNSGETIIENYDIEFVDYGDMSVAMLNTCLDVSLFELGNYYNVILTDENGISYNNKLIAQNSINGADTTTGTLSFVLTNPEEMLVYMYNVSESMCVWMLYPDSNGNYKYSGKYKVKIESVAETVEPNYVFRLNFNKSGNISSFSFYSSELKSDDRVYFEFKDWYSSTRTVCESCNENGKSLYNKLLYKEAGSGFPSGQELRELKDVKIVVNDGEKVYEFKKEDFKFVNNEGGMGCVMGEYYYVGNNSIDWTNGC